MTEIRETLIADLPGERGRRGATPSAALASAPTDAERELLRRRLASLAAIRG